MTRAQRIYRALLRAYPGSTRDAYGDDMVQLFGDRLRDARSPRGQANVWLAAIADIALTAPRERVTGRRVVKVAAGPASEAPRPLAPDLLVASSPLLLAAFLLVATPRYLVPLFDSPVYVLGLQLGTSMLVVTAILAVFGIFAARRSDRRDPRLRLLGLAVLLAPAPALLVFGAGLGPLVAYAMVMTLFVVVAPFRVVMCALGVPFAVWLVFGPAINLVIINLTL